MRNTASRAARLGIFGVCLAVAMAGGAARAEAPVVLHLSLTGVVDPFEANYVSSGIASAERSGDSAVLLTIDTPGGLDSSMRQIIQAILNANLPVICYVSPSGARAASAGTFIMESCPVAAMAPGTEIGAAHPVGVAGAIEEQKVTNDAVAYIRSLAALRGRNQNWVEQAVRNSVSVSANDALSFNVIDLVEPSTGALLQAINGRTVTVGNGASVVVHTADATISSRSLGLGARILHALLTPDFAFIFFYLGIGLLVYWLFHPHIVIPGVVGIFALLSSFVTFGLLPFQLIGVVLLLVSVVFFLLELKHPGLGLPSIGGVTTLILGGLLLFNPSVARVSILTILPVAGFAVLFFGVVLATAFRVRHLPPPAGTERLIGREGIAARDLAPDGVVQIDAEQWTAHATAGAIPRGTRVKVVSVDGLRLDVEQIATTAPVPGREGREP